MWKDRQYQNKYDRFSQTITNRLHARTWHPSNLPFRPSITADEIRREEAMRAPGKEKLQITTGYSHLSKFQDFKTLGQDARLAFAKTPGQNSITWFLF